MDFESTRPHIRMSFQRTAFTEAESRMNLS